MNSADDLVEAVARTIRERGMLKGGEHVLLAVSGGPDSLALLHVMHALERRLRLRLTIAHFDHRWRDASANEQTWVQRHADLLGIPFVGGTADSADPLPHRSPEESARIRRSRFLSATAQEVGATRIATGHTLDDQAETVLMRMLVGAGRTGLSGIPPIRWYYVRPLIDVRRAQIEEYCRALGLEPLQDPSNEDPSLLRNMIRLRTLPALRESINVRLDEQLARMADVIRDEDRYLDRQASMLVPAEPFEDGARVRLEDLVAAPVPVQRRAIRLLARLWGAGTNVEHTEAVRQLALRARPGSQLHLPGGLLARIEEGALFIGTRPAKPRNRDPVELIVPGEADLLAWNATVRSWTTSDRPVHWPDGRHECVLDLDAVRLPLRARPPREGDRFRPLGMSRSKKLGDFFTDAHVPPRARAGVPVVVDARDQIVWLVGHRLDDRVKVSAATTTFLWLSTERSE